jgi:hypothetical protein
VPQFVHYQAGPLGFVLRQRPLEHGPLEFLEGDCRICNVRFRRQLSNVNVSLGGKLPLRVTLIGRRCARGGVNEEHRPTERNPPQLAVVSTAYGFGFLEVF